MSAPKRVLIVSSNVLFAEVIAQSLSSHLNLELVSVVPETAAEEIKAFPPDVIIVDEAIGSEELGKLLIATRGLPCAQLLLMNLRGNDFIVLDSHKAVIRQATDLFETIIKDETMNHKIGSNPGTPVAVIEEAQARAGMYSFLAALYNQRPDGDLVRRLRTVGIERDGSLHRGYHGSIGGGVGAGAGGGLDAIIPRDQPRLRSHATL
jgi:DNA-binding NarL/FixJ family response regulator